MDRGLHDFAEATGMSDEEAAFGQDEFAPRQVIQMYPAVDSRSPPVAQK
jgi:hypothetical protein